MINFKKASFRHFERRFVVELAILNPLFVMSIIKIFVISIIKNCKYYKEKI